jgi:ParB family chromosome partitioning protein
MKNIALKSLEYSEKFNVRKTNKNKNLGELVSSIKNHGLLENLIVIKGRKNKFEVVAGGRRLLALNELQKEGFLKAEHQVPCEIVSKKNAEEVSLAENAVRAEMHPADQFEAFAKLFNDGKSIADIAACFGVSDSIVEKRLKLGKLSPILMGAYREDKIKLEVLMAYTLTDDHSKQEEVYHATKDSWNGDNARAIRNMLTETSISATDKIVKFIGLDAYKDAGGTLRHDLFSEANDTYLEDLELVHKLADEKLQNKADELFKKWSWCETAINSDYEILSKYDRYYPTRSAIPEELSSEHEVISEKIDELESSPEDNEKELKKLSQKFTELTEKINSYTTFKDIEYKTGGCIISIDWHGDFQITEGLIRPEDKKKIQQLEKGEDSEDTEISSASNSDNITYSQALTERLKNYRLHPVKMAVAKNFDVSFDLVFFSMCSKLFRKMDNYQYYYDSCLGLTAEEYYYPAQLASDDETCSKFKQLEDDFFNELPLDWLNLKEENEKFEAFCELKEEAKHQLFAACTAKLLKSQLPNLGRSSKLFETIKSKLNVDVSQIWRPNSSNFLERVTKSQLLDLAEELIGKEWADKHKSKKKGELVEVMNEAFNGSQKEFSEEQKQKLNSWLPEGM